MHLIRIARLLVALGAIAWADGGRAADEPVTVPAHQVRAWAGPEAGRLDAVRMRGVITFHEPETGLTFVQDGTAGVAIAAGIPSRLSAEVRVGAQVEVEGVVAPGKYAPVIGGRADAPPRVVVIGTSPLPPPLSVGLEELLGGAHDGRWVEMSGTVRHVTVRPFAPEAPEIPDGELIDPVPASAPRLVLELGTASGRFTVIFPWREGQPPPAGLTDSRVRIRGVLGSIVNRWRQWVGLLLYVPSLDEVIVERPPLADAFSLPLRRADQILGFSPATPGEDRVRVRGVVTLVQPGFRMFLRSDGGPLEVQTSLPLDGLTPGVEIEVVGYPNLEAKRALLQDCLFRVVARQAPPTPVLLSRDEALARYADGELVSFTVRLLQNALRGPMRVLVVESDRGLVEVKFATSLKPEEDRVVAGLRPGAELQLVGIAQVQGKADWGGGVKPYAVNLLLRSSDDLKLLHEPPWWTPARLLAAVGGLLLTVVLGAVWVVMLRRRVAAQTEVIHSQARREANERERRRIAQDIHDDLGSRLTQLALLGARVKAAAGTDAVTGELGERISETARTTVQTMDEIVWAVNPGNDTLQSLGDYLCKVATSLLSGAGIACQLDVPAVLPPHRISAEQRHNLVLAVREALHNVVKHSRATAAGLALRLAGPHLEIEVSDNGVGFSAASAGRGNGLGNLRRRLAELHGTCEIGPTAEAATRVRFVVPLSAP